MPIVEDVRCWLLLPTPRPLQEAPVAVRRYVSSPRAILRWLAALIPAGLALMVADRSEVSPALAAFGFTFGLPMLAVGEHLARRNRRLACEAPIRWWRVELGRPCAISRSRADGSFGLTADRREARVSLPKQGQLRAVELRLIDPLTREIRYTYANLGEPEIGEEVAVADAGHYSLLFIQDLVVHLPPRALGELPSGYARFQHG